MLFSWPVVTFFLYQRLPIITATLWSILAGALILPVETAVDLPLIPPLNKASVPNLAAFFVCYFFVGKRIKLLPNLGVVKGLLFIYILSPFVTALLNSDPIIAGPLFIKGMESYDALSAVIRQMIFIIPFLLGMNLLGNSNAHEALLGVLVVAGIFYSVPMLLEIRLSPQFHKWIYGIYPRGFGQQMRNGGFRPVVFLGHGLWVAFFTMSTVVASSIYWKKRSTVLGFSSGMILIYLCVVLYLCKSMASIIYAIFIISLIYFIRANKQAKLAKYIVLFVVLFPLLRIADYFPGNEIASTVTSYNEQRGQSLQFRFDNEDKLLTHARERLFFGWGTWGRNRVYDKSTGKDLSVTDGRWIIVLGEYGLIGYLSEFGLLALSVIRSSRAIRYLNNRSERVTLAGLSLLMAISMVDLLPNASETPWTWLLAGALIGRAEQIKGNRKSNFSKKRNKQNGNSVRV